MPVTIDRAPFTSGLPRLADILRVGRHVSKVHYSGPHAAAEWIIGIQQNSGATEAWVWAIDVMLLLHPGVVSIFDI
jgi:hypothetical protein